MNLRGAATTGLTLIALALLLSLRFVGLYSHQAFALVLLVGVAWALLDRGLLLKRGRLTLRPWRGWHEPGNRALRLQALGRGFFWLALSAASLAVFPRSAEMAGLIGALACAAVLRCLASFFLGGRANPGTTLVMVFAGVVLVVDLGRAVMPLPDPAARLSPPFEGEWLVVQGGASPMQNHHLAAYNQRFALDLLRLDETGRLFVPGESGNRNVVTWEQPLRSPADGVVVEASDTMEDSEGANLVSEPDQAAGNRIVIETVEGRFVLLAHLRHGTQRVQAGDQVSVGQPIARAGNSGNTTLPHLHLQVQTHRDLWHPDNRSLPFAFGNGGRVLRRNDTVDGGTRRSSSQLGE